MTTDKVGKLYKVKPESVTEPDIFLGANMVKVKLPNGKVESAMGRPNVRKERGEGS
jgi:hypothetical protein